MHAILIRRSRKWFGILNFLFLSVAFSSETTWNLNDVSYLFQLPQSTDQTADSLLNPQNKGVFGFLLPFEIFQKIPTLNVAGSGSVKTYEKELRVIAVRVDPCPNSDALEPCAPQVRLVWQPVEIDTKQRVWTTQDAAVHTFYQISKDEFERLKTSLWSMKIENKAKGVDTLNVSLGVHPAFSAANTKAVFLDKIKKTILTYCGEKNLVKVTFMNLLTPAVWWRFAGISPDDSGVWKPITVARTSSDFEDIFNTATEDKSLLGNPGKEMDSIFNSLPNNYPREDNLISVINKGFRKNDNADKPEFEEKLNAIQRFRNPHATNPTNLDCATCHYADSAKFYIEKRFPELIGSFSKDSYMNPEPMSFNLTNSSVGQSATRVVRAFGYFGNLPAINQRVINDSAESAHWLNTH